MKWNLLKSSYLYKSKWLTIRKDHVKIPSGHEMNDFYIIEYPSFVNIIAINKEGKCIIEKQYRHGINRIVYELPAGTIEENETPLEAAKRELLEETGFGGGRWAEYYQSAPNPSNMTSICYTFLAMNVDIINKTQLEESEDLEICLLTKNEIINILNDCSIIEGVHQASLWKYIYEDQR